MPKKPQPTRITETQNSLEHAKEALDEAYMHLHNHNLDLARNGSRDSETVNMEHTMLSHLELISRKTRTQRVTGRSEVPVDLFDDEPDDE
jgi:hypothetical protein